MAEGVDAEMPKYRSHKTVHALQLKLVERIAGPMVRLTFVEEGYQPMEVAPSVIARYTPVPGDWLIIYDDGYQSFSPPKAFEEGYTRLAP